MPKYIITYNGPGIPADGIELTNTQQVLRADGTFGDVSGGATWGGITGTLSTQTDLQSALNTKQNSLGFTPANAVHTHSQVDVINLDTSLAGKSDTGHTHANDHAKLHSITSGTDHSFPGGTATFLRADGTFATPVSGGDPFLAKLRLAADVTNATITPVNLTGMSFSYVANSFYIFDLYMGCTSAAATTGYGFAVDTSTAVTTVGLIFVHQLANTGTLTGGSSLADNVSTGVSSGVPAVTVVNPVMGRGFLWTGANTGTAQFKFRPEVAASVTCKAGSIITIMKIA